MKLLGFGFTALQYPELTMLLGAGGAAQPFKQSSTKTPQVFQTLSKPSNFKSILTESFTCAEISEFGAGSRVWLGMTVF